VVSCFYLLNNLSILKLKYSWVICGHAVLSYLQPVTNPSAEARATRSLEFTFVRSAEYAVDTFFFMSAFLATWGILRQLEKRSLTVGSYWSMMLARYLRLTPTYLLVVVVYWQVLPYVSNGPNWYHTWVLNQAGDCDATFWTNMLYINNLYPFADSGAMKSCAGW